MSWTPSDAKMNCRAVSFSTTLALRQGQEGFHTFLVSTQYPPPISGSESQQERWGDLSQGKERQLLQSKSLLCHPRLTSASPPAAEVRIVGFEDTQQAAHLASPCRSHWNVGSARAGMGTCLVPGQTLSAQASAWCTRAEDYLMDNWTDLICDSTPAPEKLHAGAGRFSCALHSGSQGLRGDF